MRRCETWHQPQTHTEYEEASKPEQLHLTVRLDQVRRPLRRPDIEQPSQRHVNSEHKPYDRCQQETDDQERPVYRVRNRKPARS